MSHGFVPSVWSWKGVSLLPKGFVRWEASRVRSDVFIVMRVCLKDLSLLLLI